MDAAAACLVASFWEGLWLAMKRAQGMLHHVLRDAAVAACVVLGLLAVLLLARWLLNIGP